MRPTRTGALAVLLLLLLLTPLGGCGSVPLGRFFGAGGGGPRASPAADPRVEQAPMGAESKGYARAYFDLPNPKAFAFSPEKGTNRHAWGQASAEVARRSALRECEEYSGTRCELFAVNDEIVWQPPPAGGDGRAVAAAAPPPRPAPPPPSPAPAATTVAATPAAAPAIAPGAEAAGASAYLVGVFDLREGRSTLLHVVNPTRADLRLFTAFFDAERRPLTCVDNRLAANDALEIDVRRAGVTAPFGSVKVVALAEGAIRPQAGVVGNQRLVVGDRTLAETGLHPVQASLLGPQLAALAPLCRW